jgi:predicted hydrocarbon binding protein
VIFAELKKFVDANMGDGAWKTLLKEAGLGNRIYLPLKAYPDEEIVALVTTASRITNIPAGDLLKAYGEFIAVDLLKMYRAFLKPDWKTLDVIENTESQVHTRVRVNEVGARPPFLNAVRVSPTEVVVHYNSERKLCAVAEGVAIGMAKHFGETATVSQSRCMHDGYDKCEIRVVVA